MSQPPKFFPFLRYDDAPAAIEWLCRVFGFEKRYVAEGKEAGAIDHAQLTLGPELIIVSTARGPERGVRREPGTFPRSGLYVYVPDLQAHYDRAKAGGAAITRPLEMNPRGSGAYDALDCEGHAWSFGTYRGESLG